MDPLPLAYGKIDHRAVGVLAVIAIIASLCAIAAGVGQMFVLRSRSLPLERVNDINRGIGAVALATNLVGIVLGLMACVEGKSRRMGVAAVVIGVICWSICPDPQIVARR